LTIAHQFLEQIEKEIRDAIFGNCSTIYCFAVGPDDAKIMSAKLALSGFAKSATWPVPIHNRNAR